MWVSPSTACGSDDLASTWKQVFSSDTSNLTMNKEKNVARIDCKEAIASKIAGMKYTPWRDSGLAQCLKKYYKGFQIPSPALSLISSPGTPLEK